MEGYQNPYNQRQQQQQMMMIGGETGDRFPQWSAQETSEFLVIRAELDRSFMETKRNKLLWEAIALKMKEKGFSRSSDQCKCKWKNLVTRYKGCETIEAEATRQQFPFYNELHAIFSARMQRMLWAEAEGSAAAPSTSAAATSGRKRAAAAAVLSSEEEAEAGEEEEDDSEGEHHKRAITSTPLGKPAKRGKKGKGGARVGGGRSSLREIVEEMMRRQEAAEEKWREAWEAREDERRRREGEWRSTMEALEKERLFLERSWREREEQRRIREDARAERRDTLITALLNRLNATVGVGANTGVDPSS